MEQKKNQQYQHNEAFCLMWYGCECGHRERIWNSRDGVTPFGIACPSCGGVASHVDWHLDSCRPDYEPREGQRIFRDGTPDEAEMYMRQRIEHFRNDFPVDEEKEAELIASARSGENHEFQEGWPTLDFHTKKLELLNNKIKKLISNLEALGGGEEHD